MPVAGKSAITSVTIGGAVVAIISGLAPLIGYTISPDDQAALANLISNGLMVASSIGSLIGGALAIWGRVRATKEITGVVTK